MPPIFEGAKLSITKILSSHFQVSHSMTLNNGSNSAYKFGANYVGTQLYTQSEVQKKKKKNILCLYSFHRYIQLFWVM
jgi:hypothetical protein